MQADVRSRVDEAVTRAEKAEGTQSAAMDACYESGVPILSAALGGFLGPTVAARLDSLKGKALPGVLVLL